MFKGRESIGVRGIRLSSDDEVVSMSIVVHTDYEPEERDRYIRWSNARRRGDELPPAPERLSEMEAQEQAILSITQNGYGKRTSAYEYRITGRGGQGIINIETSKRNGSVIATGPVEDSDEIMLVTDTGRLIRIAVGGISFGGRSTQGVTLFDVEAEERVVSVAWLTDTAETDGEPDDDDDDVDEVQASSDDEASPTPNQE